MANEIARALRKRMTRQEVKLWSGLRKLKTRGHHFRRQAPIGPYIVDFISFADKMVIETDGGQHGLADQQHRDRVRDAFLRRRGFNVLRFWNSDIDHSFNGVMETIAKALQDPHPARSASHPPRKGEG